MGYVIAIDGPAASGKTSVSRELAARLGCDWVSTGAFYRGLAYVCREMNVALDDETAIAKLAADDSVWEVRMGKAQTDVIFKGQIVTELLNHEGVGAVASKISQMPAVREALLPLQRDCHSNDRGLVAEGRDCGTVVFPQAHVKVYLTANQQDRAARRALELGVSTEETVAAQKIRDKQDSTRTVAPMQAAVDAYILDSTHLSLTEVVDAVEKFARPKLR